MPSVIMLEFNELTHSLMNRFIAEGHLPNFKRFREESHVYTTDAEEAGDNLQPWVQWVSVHTGLSASEYGITRLSDGHKLKQKAIWDLLSEAGRTVWVCGSMNARYDKPLKGLLLPDPWSTGLTPYPEEEFRSYYNYVRRSVQEHSNHAAGLSKRSALSFLWYMIRHGLSMRSVRCIAAQLWAEVTTKRFKWRRATLLDQLQWDVFHYYFQRLKPEFSTFFINSTAHFQHSHWRELDPSAFGIVQDSKHLAEFKDAILYGYQCMDTMIGRFMDLAGNDVTLIFCTALSQQPFTAYEGSGGRHFYRMVDPTVLTAKLKLAVPHTYHPVMAEQFVLRFQDSASSKQALDYLNNFRIGDRLLFHITCQEADLMVQCTQTKVVPESAVIKDHGSGREIEFYSVFYGLDNLQSGHHHPDGMLWVRYPDRSHLVHSRKCSVRSIAPAILEIFGLDRELYMKCNSFTDLSQETSPEAADSACY